MNKTPDKTQNPYSYILLTLKYTISYHNIIKSKIKSPKTHELVIPSPKHKTPQIPVDFYTLHENRLPKVTLTLQGPLLQVERSKTSRNQLNNGGEAQIPKMAALLREKGRIRESEGGWQLT